MSNSPSTGATLTRPALQGTLPSMHWRVSDLWRAPLTDLPIRDELIRQYVLLSPRMEVLEIGPGSGFPAFRLERSVAALTLLEIAQGNAADLSRRFAKTPKVEVVLGDVCSERLGRERAASYDAIIAIEVLEFLPHPTMALRNMARMLRPEGRLFMQFPNYQSRDWPTFYRSRGELEGQLRAAGFVDWRIYTLGLSPWAQRLFHWLHEVPVRHYRAHQNAQRQRPQQPHRYDETWAFHHGHRLEAFKLPIHLYWAAIMILMRLGGDVFRRTESDDEILGKNLFVAARRGKNGSVSE